MKTKLLRKVRSDARRCWNSISSISTCHGRICKLKFPSENADVLRYFIVEKFDFNMSDADKNTFINRVIHRFWNVRKYRYYAKCRKAVIMREWERIAQ